MLLTWLGWLILVTRRKQLLLDNECPAASGTRRVLQDAFRSSMSKSKINLKKKKKNRLLLSGIMEPDLPSCHKQLEKWKNRKQQFLDGGFGSTGSDP